MMNTPDGQFEGWIIRTTGKVLLAATAMKLVWHEIEPIVSSVRHFLGW